MTASVNPIDATHEQIALDLKQSPHQPAVLGLGEGRRRSCDGQFRHGEDTRRAARSRISSCRERGLRRAAGSPSASTAACAAWISRSSSFGPETTWRSRQWQTAGATTSRSAARRSTRAASCRASDAGATSGSADIFPIDISLDLNEVTGQNKVSLSDVTGTMTVTSKGLDAVSLKGRRRRPALRVDARPRGEDPGAAASSRMAVAH